MLLIGWGDRVRMCTLSVLAGAIHLSVTPAHFEEWWGYGAFFAVVAAVQVLYGLAWLGVRPDPALLRPLAASGIGLHLALLVLYLVTRTIGTPMVGPHAGETEPVGALDFGSKLIELLLTVSLVEVLRGIGAERRRAGRDPASR